MATRIMKKKFMFASAFTLPITIPVIGISISVFFLISKVLFKNSIKEVKKNPSILILVFIPLFSLFLNIENLGAKSLLEATKLSIGPLIFLIVYVFFVNNSVFIVFFTQYILITNFFIFFVMVLCLSTGFLSDYMITNGARFKYLTDHPGVFQQYLLLTGILQIKIAEPNKNLFLTLAFWITTIALSLSTGGKKILLTLAVLISGKLLIELNFKMLLIVIVAIVSIFLSSDLLKETPVGWSIQRIERSLDSESLEEMDSGRVYINYLAKISIAENPFSGTGITHFSSNNSHEVHHSFYYIIESIGIPLATLYLLCLLILAFGNVTKRDLLNRVVLIVSLVVFMSTVNTFRSEIFWFILSIISLPSRKYK